MSLDKECHRRYWPKFWAEAGKAMTGFGEAPYQRPAGMRVADAWKRERYHYGSQRDDREITHCVSGK
ncbi:hypothetical protein KCP75_23920 [Salmonella enterica subsp. enterica]|nr:hypothetical protein KCP75_23920 [Salmonella enterica subsp. enterica]